MWLIQLCLRRAIHRGNQFCEIDCIKLESRVPWKNTCFKLEFTHRATWNSWAVIVSWHSVGDLQFKTTAFFDETVVSSFMKPISWNWFPLCVARLSETAELNMKVFKWKMKRAERATSPEDGTNMFLRNVGIYLQVDTAFKPRRPTSTSRGTSCAQCALHFVPRFNIRPIDTDWSSFLKHFMNIRQGDLWNITYSENLTLGLLWFVISNVYNLL
jgi:hypothetical protein